VSDWPLVTIRWALYADLGLLFGIPLFALYTVRGAVPPIGRVCAVLAAAGLVLSLLGFAVSAAAMGGTTLDRIDWATISALLWQTDLGWAWLVRMAALSLALALSLWPAISDRVRAIGLSASGAVIVASLAWFGHGVAGEGVGGLIHLAADIAHLLAASAWIGALVILLKLVGQRAPLTRSRVASAQAALAGFSMAGTVMVAIITVTGLINGVFLIGPGAILTFGNTPYGQILIAKLLLFAMMLGCASLNRFHLTPRLAAEGQESGAALAALRRSIAIETMFALIVLGLVGWLGTLEPPGLVQ
jgi:putative copper resistance protein D